MMWTRPGQSRRSRSTRAWLHAACLDNPIELAPQPPELERCGVPALDAARALPPLPPPVLALFDATRDPGDLAAPRTRWVAVVGEIDRVLAPDEPADAEPADAAATASDADA